MESRKKRTLFEMAEDRRKAAAKRDKTRVVLGQSFTQWRTLKAQKGFRTDQDMAKFLLDSYEKFSKFISPQKTENTPPNSPNALKSDKDEMPIFLPAQATSPSLPSASGLKCPACGFVLKVQDDTESRQPQSIEVTVELGETKEAVSDEEEADGESEEEEELEEEVEEEKEEEESEGSVLELKKEEDRGYDWTPEVWLQSAIQTAVREEQSADQAVPKQKKQLCTDCGAFYKTRHDCDHKTKPFVCDVCGGRFVSESGLKVHSNIHSETHQFHCKYCNAGFKTRPNKLVHELIHQKRQDPFKCPDCALTFTSYRKRVSHRKEHKKDKFTCKMCGIQLNNEQSFTRHVIVHSGERPFKCFVCDTGFKQESHLKSHMRLHTGERPFSCKHCQKSFNHNVSLKSHMQKYHPEEEEEEQETDKKEERNKQTKDEEMSPKYKSKRPPTGRPRGRPKRNTEGKEESSRRKRTKRKQCNEDCDSEEEYDSEDLTWE